MKELLNKLKALKLDNKKLFLIAFVSLLMLYIDFNFVLNSQLKSLKGLGRKITELKNDINNLNKELVFFEDLEHQQGKGEKQKVSVGPKEIISEDKLLVLLETISGLANENKVKIMQINTPKDIKTKEVVIAGSRLMPVAITLDLSCSYHSLGVFLNALEKTRYFIALEEMKITRDREDYFLQKVSLVLRTYAKK